MPRSIYELPPSERLAIEQALFNRLGEDVSTKNPDSLRYAADSDMIETYRNTGYKSRDVMVNGTKVGTHSVRISKGKDAQTVKRLAVMDGHELEQFVQSDECADERAEYLALMAQNFAEWMLETYGIVCDGCEVVTEIIHAQPPTVLGTTLRIDAEKVSAALNGYLDAPIAGLIGGGDA
jgi:hypothetical protein